MPLKYDTSGYKASIPGDHFWFTATTIGLNGFLISKAKAFTLTWPTVVWIGFLNLYALFLILQRSASHADKLKLPDRCSSKSQEERGFADKWAETTLNVKVAVLHVPFVVGEFSGALFYMLLIITSYIGVVSSHLF